MRRPSPNRSSFVVLSLGAALAVAGCSGRTEAASDPNSVHGAGSLIGTWRSPTPLSRFRTGGSPPVWLRLRFRPDGKVSLHFAPALSPYLEMSSAPVREYLLKRTLDADYAYEILDDKHVRILIGDTAETFAYEVSGSRLLMTLAVKDGGDGITHVYERK